MFSSSKPDPPAPRRAVRWPVFVYGYGLFGTAFVLGVLTLNKGIAKSNTFWMLLGPADMAVSGYIVVALVYNQMRLRKRDRGR